MVTFGLSFFVADLVVFVIVNVRIEYHTVGDGVWMVEPTVQIDCESFRSTKFVRLVLLLYWHAHYVLTGLRYQILSAVPCKVDNPPLIHVGIIEAQGIKTQKGEAIG